MNTETLRGRLGPNASRLGAYIRIHLVCFCLTQPREKHASIQFTDPCNCENEGNKLPPLASQPQTLSCVMVPAFLQTASFGSGFGVSHVPHRNLPGSSSKTRVTCKWSRLFGYWYLDVQKILGHACLYSSTNTLLCICIKTQVDSNA